MSDAKTKMVIEVRDEGDSSKRMEVLGAVSAGEIVEVTVDGLPETRLTLEQANAGLTLRLVAPDAAPPVFGLDRQGPVVIAQTEPGSWTRDTDGRLVATLSLATVQALALLPPFPPPAPAIPAVRRFPPPPPPPSPYELTAFGARMATALLEYRDSDTAQTLFGAAPMTLLPWPPDGRTVDLLDLATGRVYSKAEVDALLAEKATVTALETVRTTANAANSAASAADGKAQTALNGLAGKADLVNGKVPSSQLPSYVDDVLEYASRSAFPATGETGKIYVALDTNKTYRWSGSEYVEISNPDLSGYATKADATLTKASGLSDWAFNDGLLGAAQEYFGQGGYPRLATDSHLELIEESGGFGLWIVADEGSPRIDFGGGTLSEDGLVAYMSAGMPFVAPYISPDGSIARRMAYDGYRLGLQSDKPIAPAGDYALRSELGTAAARDVPASGDASATQVVLGNDTRLAAVAGRASQTALAPAFVAKSYAVGDLCTYNGLLYRCKEAYTATAQSAKPDSDTTHWEAAVVAVLLDGKVSKAGDTMTGGLTVPNLTVGSRVYGSTVGDYSTAEGFDTTASGSASHAEGYGTTSSAFFSHAEGDTTTASGNGSHTEGFGTTASGDYSHAEGMTTTAQNEAEHAQGAFNASHTGATDAAKTLHSVGCGTAHNNRKNAVETMRDGKTYLLGVGSYDGTNPNASGVKDLATAINAKAEASQIPAVSSETWTFVIDDGQGGTSTVTKNVAVYAAQTQGAGA